MKKTISITFLLLIGLTGFSQVKKIDKFDYHMYTGKLSNEDFFRKADFIFEGENIESYNYLSNDSTKVYSTGVIRITEIYKGGDKLKAGKIRLIMDAGSYTDIRIENGVDKSFSLDYNLNSSCDLGRKNIYFCTVSDFPKGSLDIKIDNNIVVKLLRNEPYANLCFSDTEDYNFEMYGLNNLYFKTKQDFYDYASKFRHISIPGSVKKKAEQRVLLNGFMKKQFQLAEIAKKNEKNKT